MIIQTRDLRPIRDEIDILIISAYIACKNKIKLN